MEIPAVALFLPLPAFALVAPLVDTLVKGRNLAGYWTLAGLLTALTTNLLLLGSGVSGPQVFFGVLRLETFSLFFSLVFLVVATLVNVASLEYMKENPNKGVYYSLLLLATLGMMLVSFSIDLVVLYLAWELMSIPTYVLAGIDKSDPTSNEAAIKYFLISALSSALIVYAISLSFGLTGSTNIYEVSATLSQLIPGMEPLALLAIVLFTAGFGMKVAAVPFHMWVPDAYEGAPTTIGAFLAAGTKNGGFAALLRVFPVALIAFRLDWTATFAILAVLTMTLGNIAALMQKSFTRLLAYSSIAHAGYIMIGLAAPSALGLSGALYHILNQALMKTAAFIAAAAVFRALSTTSVEGYSGLGSRMPVTALTLTFSLFALAGVPPLNGFMSKLVLFTAAIDANISWLALAGVLNSAFSLGYYGWIVKRMYFDEAPTGTPAPENLAFVLPLIAVTILIVVTGVFPQPILALTRGIAEGL
jgi:NADH-quinone oxidoreductase subunit N